MNLQQVLEYREQCLICHQPMMLTYLPEDAEKGMHCFVNENGLRVRHQNSRDIFYLFSFSGRVLKGKRDFGVGYKTPFHFIKQCPSCKPQYFTDDTITVKSRSVGATTVQAALTSYFSGMSVPYSNTSWSSTTGRYTSMVKANVRVCGYTFVIVGEKERTFRIEMQKETIKYAGDNAFYHISTNFTDNKTIIQYGLYSSSPDEILKIETASRDMSHLKTRQDLVGKLKLYNLFS
jgi:hypothetical protein